MYDVELADYFFKTLKRGTVDEIDNAYYSYIGYVRNIRALDSYIPVNEFIEDKVDVMYRDWNLQKSEREE